MSKIRIENKREISVRVLGYRLNGVLYPTVEAANAARKSHMGKNEDGDDVTIYEGQGPQEVTEDIT